MLLTLLIRWKHKSLQIKTEIKYFLKYYHTGWHIYIYTLGNLKENDMEKLTAFYKYKSAYRAMFWFNSKNINV